MFFFSFSFFFLFPSVVQWTEPFRLRRVASFCFKTSSFVRDSVAGVFFLFKRIRWEPSQKQLRPEKKKKTNGRHVVVVFYDFLRVDARRLRRPFKRDLRTLTQYLYPVAPLSTPLPWTPSLFRVHPRRFLALNDAPFSFFKIILFGWGRDRVPSRRHFGAVDFLSSFFFLKKISFSMKRGRHRSFFNRPRASKKSNFQSKRPNWKVNQ